MFDRIMVLLDGSPAAERALPYAEHLAATAGGALHLARVVELPAAVRSQPLGAPVNVYEPVIAAQRQEATAYLERVSARLTGTGRAVRIRLLDGDPATAVLDYARAEGIDVVVLTTHGRGGLTRWALGSVADRVAQGDAPAVLLVRATATDQADGVEQA